MLTIHLENIAKTRCKKHVVQILENLQFVTVKDSEVQKFKFRKSLKQCRASNQGIFKVLKWQDSSKPFDRFMKKN